MGEATTSGTDTEMLSHVSMRVRIVYECVPGERVSDRPAAGDWALAALLPDDADLQASAVADTDGPRLVHAGLDLTLDRDEAEGYYLNLTSPDPSLFALMRSAPGALPDTVSITASYSEAARWMDAGMHVLRGPLPEPLLAWIAEFAQHHYVTVGPKKRAGVRPSFLSRDQFGEQARRAAAGTSDRDRR